MEMAALTFPRGRASGIERACGEDDEETQRGNPGIILDSNKSKNCPIPNFILLSGPEQN